MTRRLLDDGNHDMAQVLLRMLAALLLGLSGHTATETPPPQDPGLPAWAIGTPVTTWDQGRLPDLQDNPELPVGPVLIATESDRNRLLDSQPLGPGLEDVAAVDLQNSVLVVSGYHSCTEQGTVWTDGLVVWWDARPPAGTELVNCAWAPFTVDITEVPRSAFTGEPALVAPPWGE